MFVNVLILFCVDQTGEEGIARNLVWK